MYIITREENQYDQMGEYFQVAYYEKPTIDQIQNSLDIEFDLAKHIYNGGGRLRKEQTLFNLINLKEGELYQ